MLMTTNQYSPVGCILDRYSDSSATIQSACPPTDVVLSVQVYEDAMEGEIVLVVMATDIDSGTNADLTFSFQNPLAAGKVK